MRYAAILAIAAGLGLSWSPMPAVDPGQQTFEKRCGGCHSADQAKEGPPLRGVFGRAAGTSSGYPYSAGLKASGVKWDAATLDKWLTDPSAVVPATDMAFRLNDAAERERIIGYLKALR